MQGKLSGVRRIRLVVDAHKRRFDVVCVWQFDRFAHSASHLLRALETFKALRIDFVSFSEQMDTSTPAGKIAGSLSRNQMFSTRGPLNSIRSV